MGEMCLYERATFQQGQHPPVWLCAGKGSRGPEVHDLFAMSFCLLLYLDNICFPSIEAGQCVPFLFLLPTVQDGPEIQMQGYVLYLVVSMREHYAPVKYL